MGCGSSHVSGHVEVESNSTSSFGASSAVPMAQLKRGGMAALKAKKDALAKIHPPSDYRCMDLDG